MLLYFASGANNQRSHQRAFQPGFFSGLPAMYGRPTAEFSIQNPGTAGMTGFRTIRADFLMLAFINRRVVFQTSVQRMIRLITIHNPLCGIHRFRQVALTGAVIFLQFHKTVIFRAVMAAKLFIITVKRKKRARDIKNRLECPLRRFPCSPRR